MGDALGTFGAHVVHEDFYGTVGALATSGVGSEAPVYTTDETDGIIALVTASGAGNTCVIGLNAVFSPATNGPLAIEARVKHASLADAAWVGFATQSGGTDEVVDGGSLDGGTVDAVGLYYDDGADANQWYEYVATASAETQQNLVTEVITADEWQVIRVEVDPDGTVRTYIAAEFGATSVGEGSLRLIEERGADTVSTTALLFPEVYSAANSGTAQLEVDYLHFTANRDWAVD